MRSYDIILLRCPWAVDEVDHILLFRLFDLWNILLRNISALPVCKELFQLGLHSSECRIPDDQQRGTGQVLNQVSWNLARSPRVMLRTPASVPEPVKGVA